jgi:CRP-like cAMP-binding protein
VLAKVQAWQLMPELASRQAEILDQRFVRVLLELARDRPELVTLQDVKRDQALITQDRKTDSVYLVLSGQFQIFQNGELLVREGRPRGPAPGTVLGEISALQGCLPTATVGGDGVVLRIAKAEFLRQLDINPAFRDSVEELVTVRLELDRLRQG